MKLQLRNQKKKQKKQGRRQGLVLQTETSNPPYSRSAYRCMESKDRRMSSIPQPRISARQSKRISSKGPIMFKFNMDLNSKEIEKSNTWKKQQTVNLIKENEDFKTFSYQHDNRKSLGASPTRIRAERLLRTMI